jgi:hypothetical protein
MSESQSNTGRVTEGGSIINTVKDRATEQLSNQKGRATDGLDAIALAVRRTTQELRGEQHETLADYVDRAATQLEQFASTLRDKDLGELLTDVKGLARRQPALFIGGSFVGGILVARFLKSSRSSNSTNTEYLSTETTPFEQTGRRATHDARGGGV